MCYQLACFVRNFLLIQVIINFIETIFLHYQLLLLSFNTLPLELLQIMATLWLVKASNKFAVILLIYPENMACYHDFKLLIVNENVSRSWLRSSRLPQINDLCLPLSQVIAKYCVEISSTYNTSYIQIAL